jgi:hypothetical protein
VVVRDLDVLCILILPSKTDPVLLVDADAVLAAAGATEHLEAIPTRDNQMRHVAHAIDLIQLPSRNRPDGYGARAPRSLGVQPEVHVLGSTISE